MLSDFTRGSKVVAVHENWAWGSLVSLIKKQSSIFLKVQGGLFFFSMEKVIKGIFKICVQVTRYESLEYK